MMGDRRTPYKFGNRVGPDIPRIVAQHPQDCLVHYKGNWYKLVICNWTECPRHAKPFWRRYGRHSIGRIATLNSKQTYCSEECAEQGAKLLNRAAETLLL